VTFGYLILFQLPTLCIIKEDAWLIMNGELKIAEYLKLSCDSSGETEATTGIANLPGDVQAI
jgi:hypothetical protein